LAQKLAEARRQVGRRLGLRPKLDQARLAAHLMHVVHQVVHQPRLAAGLEQGDDLGEAFGVGRRRRRLARRGDDWLGRETGRCASASATTRRGR
jgi:hypothetical protein